MNLNYHVLLSKYFAAKPLYLDEPTQKKPNIRKLIEQTWQQTKGEMWDEVTDTLCNLDFIQAKAAAKMTFDLSRDFDGVLMNIPENAEYIRQEKARQERKDKYTKDLINYAKGKIKILEMPERITLWTDEQVKVETERIKTNPARVDILKDFLNFLGQEANNLQIYASEFAGFARHQAWNYAAEGPVGSSAKRRQYETVRAQIIRDMRPRPPWNPLPQLRQTLNRHSSFVSGVSITPDGKRAISASWDNTCILWDPATGEGLFTLKGHKSGINAVSIATDGRLAVTGSGDSTCILWDLSRGEAIQTLKGHSSSVNAISITPHGLFAISGSNDKTCIVWDLTSGRIRQTLSKHENAISTVCITPDGSKAISGSFDETIILWDLIKNEALAKLIGHTGDVRTVSITPDCKTAISGSDDKTCIVWDLGSGKKLKTLRGHNSSVRSVSITPDGNMAISGSDDRSCIIWDIKTGTPLKTLRGHNSPVLAVSINSDGDQAISGSEDKTCILWNLKG